MDLSNMNIGEANAVNVDKIGELTRYGRCELNEQKLWRERSFPHTICFYNSVMYFLS